MKRIQFIMLAILMLVATPALFTSCQEDAPEIDYTMNVSVINDFTKVVEAINNGTLQNVAAVNALAKAIDQMNTDQAGKLQTLTDVLSSTNATLETKLTVIEGAMKAQTLALNAKLALLETAVNNQTLKIDEAGKLIAGAIDNSSDELSSKLAAIKDIIESTSATTAEKLSTIEGAMKAHTLALSAKLALLQEAVDNQTLKQEELAGKFSIAIDNLSGNSDLKLQEVSAALAAMNTMLETKLAAIEGAMGAQTLALGEKLDLLKGAIEGLPDYSSKFDAVTGALEALKAQLEALGGSQEAIVTQIENTAEAIQAINRSLQMGGMGAAAAMQQLLQKLDELRAAIGSGGGMPEADMVFLCHGKADEATLEADFDIDPSECTLARITLAKGGMKLIADFNPQILFSLEPGLRFDLSGTTNNPLVGHPENGLSLVDKDGNEIRWSEAEGLPDAGSWMTLEPADDPMPPHGAPRRAPGGGSSGGGAAGLGTPPLHLVIHATATRDGKTYKIDVDVTQPFKQLYLDLNPADVTFRCNNDADDVSWEVNGRIGHLTVVKGEMKFVADLAFFMIPDIGKIRLSGTEFNPIAGPGLGISLIDKDGNETRWDEANGLFDEGSRIEKIRGMVDYSVDYPMKNPPMWDFYATATRNGKTYKIKVTIPDPTIGPM